MIIWINNKELVGETAMIYEKVITFQNRKGLHTRAAAIVVYKATRINKKFGVNLYIQKDRNDSRIPMASMLALTAIGIKRGEKIIIGCEGNSNCTIALKEMEKFLIGEIDNESENIDEIDRVLDKNTLTSDRLIESISNGVLVVNEENVVILFNKAAEKITGIPRNEIIGMKAYDLLEGSKLHEVISDEEKVIQDKQKLGNTTIITNRSPIIKDDKVIGAIAIFQDISEIERLSNQLDSVLEMKERFGNILNYANDAITMVDEFGNITYVNPEFERVWNVKKDEIKGKYIEEIVPNCATVKVIETKKKQLGIVVEKDEVKVIANASPIIIDGVFKGVVSISKEVTEIQKIMQKLNDAQEKMKYFKEELDRKENIHKAFEIIIGKSGALEDVLFVASKAAKTSASVLIYGESGTGKELIAKAIASASSRKDKSFVRLNCAAIPENLLESELFGHVKGAFTGAIKDKLGKFELANEGTIFLDEIGDLSLEMQVKLLRVLQEKEFEKVGGTNTIKVDVRVIAATNKNLEQMLKEGKFREDLYYRLNVIAITLPSLKDRKGDIPLLVEHLIEKICKKEGIDLKRVSSEFLEQLEMYNWPGNIRELENIIERAIALSDEDILEINSLPSYIKYSNPTEDKELINVVNGELATLEDYEKKIIELALKKYKSYNKAGKALGITHRTVALKAKKYGLL